MPSPATAFTLPTPARAVLQADVDAIDADDYLRRILTARVYDVARETPLDLAPSLSARLGHQVWLKR